MSLGMSVRQRIRRRRRGPRALGPKEPEFERMFSAKYRQCATYHEQFQGGYIVCVLCAWVYDVLDLGPLPHPMHTSYPNPDS